MANGQIYSERAKVPFIAPVQIAAAEDLAKKYRDCAGLVLSERDVEVSLNLIKNLENLTDIIQLTEIIVKEKN